MSETVTKLWTGYDLGNAYSQISCYNERRKETDSICLPGKKNAYEIPTCLAYNVKDGSWRYGEVALAEEGKDWILLKDFLTDYENTPDFTAGGQTFEKKELLFKCLPNRVHIILLVLF